MKKQSRNTQGLGAWVLGGIASVLMCVSAYGQYVATQSTPVSIPDSGTGTPYPSKIDLTMSGILGVIENVSVTVNNVTHPYAPDIALLLTGPNGKAVVLMSNCGANPTPGGSAALVGETFVFSDAASGNAPTTSPLVSGSSYKPTNNGADNGALSFPGPAPAPPYSSTLSSAFAGISANGVWSLFVLDTTPGPPTSLTPQIASWSLNINTTPTITVTNPTVRISENGSATINVVVSSSSTPVGNLTVSATKISNLATNFSTGGSGGLRTLTISPNATTFGTNTLTISVGDGISSVSTTVTLEVPHVIQPPSIALSTNNLTTIAGLMTTNVVIATLADADINFDPNTLANLNLTVTSSDSTIVAPSDVFFDFFTPGGDKRTISVIPSGTGTGTATLTVSVDNGSLTNSQTLTVTVLPVNHPTFANTASISATASGTGSSSIVIAANTVSGLIGKATVILNGIKNFLANSSGFTLTAPGGTSVPLFLTSGPATQNNYGQILFADANTGSLPTSSDETNTISLAPASPLSALIGLNPNGTWTLTVTNGGTSTTQLIDGWFLNIFAAPTVSSIPNVFAQAEATTNVSFTVGDIDGTVTNITATVPAGAFNGSAPRFTAAISGNNVTLTIQGGFNGFGTNTVTVVAKDNNGFTSAAQTFTLGLSFLDHTPTISFIGRQVTSAGAVLGPLSVTVGSINFLPSQLTVTVTSDNQSLIPNANLSLQPTSTGTSSSTNYNLIIFPIGTLSGTANVTINVSDGILTGTEAFQVFVQSPGVPLFAARNSIFIVPSGPGINYPSTNTVSGLIGTVEKVTLTLFDITDPTPGGLQLLLVGPTGTNVFLMAGAGGNNPLNNTTVVFDDAAAAGGLPQNAQILSGTYTPSVYGSPGPFPAPAMGLPPLPPTPYGTALAGFAGTNGNGDWKLYVADNGSPQSSHGSLIANGWQLSIQTAPSILPIADQSTPENTTARVVVTVGDNQPGVNLTVTASGSATLFQQPIGVSGSGATRTLTIVPQPYTFGTNLISVTAMDPAGKSSTATFNMGVRFVPQPPLFTSTPANQSIPAATQLPPVSFTVWSPQASALGVTAVSPDNPGLVPSVQVTQTGSVGNTNSYSLTLIPAGVQTGTATINIVATDSAGLRATSSFTLTVTPALAFANTSAISIPQGPTSPGVLSQGESTPYPSAITVTGLGGVVSSVQATLVGLNHQFPHDLDILLVGPDRATAVMLMAHAALGGTATEARLMFKDGFAPVPASIMPSGPLNTGTYGVSDDSTDQFPAPGITLPTPAPGRPYANALAGFNGLSPNGSWNLYVLDDTFPTGGNIDTGWILYLQTAPLIAPIGLQTTLENTPLNVPLTLSDSTVDPTNLIVTVVNSGDFPPNLANTFAITGTGASLNLKITPTLNLPSAYNALNGYTNRNGTNLITVTAADPINHLTNRTSFGLTVQYVNQPPTVSTATNGVYVNENANTTIAYTVGDVDSIMDKSNIVVTSSDQSLLANSNIVVTGSAIAPGATGTINVKVTPTANKFGSLALTFVASDGVNFVTNVLTLNITHIYQVPTISTIPSPIPVIAGNPTTNISFTVGSVEVASSSLQVFAQSSNPALVPNTPANIVLGGSGNNRTIQVFTIGSASASTTITVWVIDPLNPSSTNSSSFTSFTLNATAVNNLFANTAGITTSGAGKANLYPSSISVAGLVGATFKVSVILPNFNHNAPSNLDVLLVEEGNDGRTNAVVLMSGAGDNTAVSNLRLTFDDAGGALPTTNALTSATYQPGNLTTALSLPAPAPASSTWSTFLRAFAGFNPNGTWKLFVNDRGSGDAGNISAGWQLVIQTAPTIALTTASPVTIVENQSGTVNFTIGDMLVDVSNLVVSATSDNPTVIPTRDVSFSGFPISGSSGNLVATVTPETLQSGTAHLTFTVTRSDGANASATITVNVTPVNVPPTISRLPDISMNENTTQTIQFLVSDPDNPLSTDDILATSDNPAVITSTSLTFFSSGTNHLFGLPNNVPPQTSLVSLNLNPVAFASGSAHITITVNDPLPAYATNVSATFMLTVNKVYYPPFFISSPGPQSVAAGGTIGPISFAIASPTAAATTLVMTGHSSDQTLIKDSNIIFGPAGSPGTNRTVTLTAQANTTGGTATITLTATDPANPNNATQTATFTVTVRASRVRTYTNSGQITISANSTATPYPSSVVVSNLVGPISKVTATLNGFTHTFPSDVGVLLVGPTGQKIVLQNMAGDGSPVANLSLTFDQSAASPIPMTPLASGSYQPADYRQVNFQGVAPTGPYTNTLNAFNGTNPNGTWSLFVEDFLAPDQGAISNGWSLAITTLPVINGLANVTTNENSSAVQSFTTADDTLSSLIFNFSATSDNQSVVTNNGVVFTGSGTNWTVTVNPVPNTFGSANITVTMINGDGQSVQATFKATFTQVFYPPTITAIPNTTINAGTAASVALSYANIGYSQSQLSVSFASSNTNLVPLGNIKQVGGQLLISPVGVQTGSSQITVTVTNPNSQSTNTSFTLTVLAGSTPVFANTAGITINDDAPATPYPSTITVAGLSGSIAKVTATAAGITHSFPSDVSLLLVGPQGQAVVLMSHAGGSAPLSNTRVTFDDAASTSLPQFTLITDGTYQPTDYKASDSFFAGPPPPPYSHNLFAFTNTNPNGTWSLYVMDDSGTPAPNGSITGGWILSIVTTGPSISSPGPQTTPENTRLSVPFTVNSTITNPTNLIVTATNSGDMPAGLVANLTVTGTGTARTLLISPTPNLPSTVTTNNGTSTITLSVTDGTLTNSISFPLTVTYSNLPPTITGLSDLITPANVPVTETFTVADVDDAISNLVVKASVTNSSLGSVTLTTTTNGVESIKYTPSGAFGGTNRVIVTVADKATTVTNSFAAVATRAIPILGAIANHTNLVNQNLTLSLALSDPAVALNLLTYTSSNSNSNLISAITFATSSTRAFADIVVVPNALGTASVTIGVSDGVTNVTQTFQFTVRLPITPTLAPITNQVTKVNTPTNVTLSVTSPDTALANLTYTGSGTNGLVQSVKFTVGSTVVATINVVSNRVGRDFVTIGVNNGLTNVTQSFQLTVAPSHVVVLAPIANQNTTPNNPAKVVLAVTDPDTAVTNLSFTATSTNKALVSGIAFSFNGTSEVATVNLVTNQIGTDFITISVTDGFSTNAQSFVLGVRSVVQLAPIANQSTTPNTPVKVVLAVTYPDTAVTNLTFSGTSTNTALVSGVSFSFNGTNEVATVNLVSNKFGTDFVTIAVTDGFTTAKQSFVLTVRSVVQLAPIANQSTTANKPAMVPLTVTYPDTAVTNLNFTGTSTNKALVSGITFTFNGTNEIAVVNLVTNQSGTDFVTISVTDGFTTASQSFLLTVTKLIAGQATLKVSLSGKQVIIRLTGTANGSYDLQTSTDLKTWTDAGLITADSTGAFSVTNTITLPAQFLRAVSK